MCIHIYIYILVSVEAYYNTPPHIRYTAYYYICYICVSYIIALILLYIAGDKRAADTTLYSSMRTHICSMRTPSRRRYSRGQTSGCPDTWGSRLSLTLPSRGSTS